MFEIIFVSAIVLCAAIAVVVLVMVVRSVYGKTDDQKKTPTSEPKQDVDEKPKSYYETLSDEVELTKVLSAGRQLNNAGLPIRLKNLKNSRSYSLTVCPELIIGRLEVDGVFTISNDPAVSKKHCRLYINNNSLWIEDLKSANHTFMNGQTVTSPTPVKSGDELKVGNTHLLIFY